MANDALHCRRAILEILVFIVFGIIAGTMEGMAGYYALFGVVVFSMVSANIGHGAMQGLIPDLVPAEKRGRYSAIKAFFELPLPLIVVSFTVSRMISAGNLWAAIITVCAVIFVCAALSMFIRETPQKGPVEKVDWESIGRLLVMTLAFTAIILALGWGVRLLLPYFQTLNATMSLVLTGIVGIVGMLLAIALGVFFRCASASANRPKNARLHLVGHQSPRISGRRQQFEQLCALFHSGTLPQYAGASAAAPTAQLMLIVGVSILLIRSRLVG